MQRVELHDTIELAAAPGTSVEGFEEDTAVTSALAALAAAAGVDTGWHVHIEKRIPVAAGLGGGSTDAARALQLANATLPRPLGPTELHAVAASIGADVPFFLEQGPQLATGTGTALAPVTLPGDYAVVLVLPRDAVKESTAAVYAAFDRPDGFPERKERLLKALSAVERPADLAAFPPNDLASSPMAEELRRLGAFRADVSGAGPTVYGLFIKDDLADRAAEAVAALGDVWLTRPAW
jgi:4-diphosphocytidyl-2-C-methyl-D-erythritol kinase